MYAPHHVTGNRLLGLFAATASGWTVPGTRRVWMDHRRVLNERGAVIEAVYFPMDAVVSVLEETADGQTSAVAMIGNEGLVGIGAVMSGMALPGRDIVHTPGWALVMPASTLRRGFDDVPQLRAALLRFTQSLMLHMAQTALCNRHHTIHQQVCRWLLVFLDLHPGNDIVVTQSALAEALGVRREGVTLALTALHRLGAVDHTRGHILVTSRRRLEAECCECYAALSRGRRQLES